MDGQDVVDVKLIDFGNCNDSSVGFKDWLTRYVSVSICDSNANGSASGTLIWLWARRLSRLFCRSSSASWILFDNPLYN